MELLLPLLFILPLLWLFSRQRKQQRSQARLQDGLQPGQEVMTTAGMFGRVVRVEGEVMVLEMSPGVQMRFLTAALARVVPAEQGLPADGDPAPALTAEDDELATGPRPHTDAPHQETGDAPAPAEDSVDLRKHENTRREA